MKKFFSHFTGENILRVLCYLAAGSFAFTVFDLIKQAFSGPLNDWSSAYGWKYGIGTFWAIYVVNTLILVYCIFVLIKDREWFGFLSGNMIMLASFSWMGDKQDGANEMFGLLETVGIAFFAVMIFYFRSELKRKRKLLLVKEAGGS